MNGFPPDPASLAPAGLARGRSSPLHLWWGPLYLMVFGVVWRLSGSYALLQAVVPVAAGGVVILTCAFGSRFIGQRGGVLAAALLALFPIFREHSPLSFVESLSALLMWFMWLNVVPAIRVCVPFRRLPTRRRHPPSIPSSRSALFL